MKKLVALTGSGISAESGLRTFRDSGGLWEGYDITDVASPEGWYSNPVVVLDFYNQRRKQAIDAQPNNAHKILAEFEKYFYVTVITQNVDNLHEKAGSSNVIHLHGELFKSRSTIDETLIYDIPGWELNMGDLCEKGSQLRPHIVWFGEMVPLMDKAINETISADIFVVIGTSLVVYPAAGLLDYVPGNSLISVVDPNIPVTINRANIHFIQEKASSGMEKLKEKLLSLYL
jgi:NAD-dependent deacetylase